MGAKTVKGQVLWGFAREDGPRTRAPGLPCWGAAQGLGGQPCPEVKVEAEVEWRTRSVSRWLGPEPPRAGQVGWTTGSDAADGRIQSEPASRQRKLKETNSNANVKPTL